MQHPTRVGKYDLEEFLGGGMSHVYRARDTVIGRTVAVKILTPEGCENADVRNRFLLEARMAGNVSHENVICIYDFGEDNGKPFLVMEFLRGETLRNIIKEHRNAVAGEILSIALQLARALEYVHSQDIVHRDIKPENVHVSAQGVVKLMDFGIAKAHGLSTTQAGFILGTPYYMAPEQVRGEEITPLTDVFSFGVLLYELFTGEVPCKNADRPERVFYCIVAEKASAEPLQSARVSEPVQGLILQCLSKNPADRPQSFHAICIQLAELLAREQGYRTEESRSSRGQKAMDPAETPTTTVKLPSQLGTRSQKGWWIGGIAAMLAAIGLIGLFVFTRSKEQAAEKKATQSLPREIETTTGKMVLVPGGKFISGETAGKRVHLPDFYVDKTEVTNGMYAAFCRATANCKAPDSDPEYPVTHLTIADAQQFAVWARKRLPKDAEWEKAARGTDGRSFPWGSAEDKQKANLERTDLMGVAAFPEGASPFGALQMTGNVWELVDQNSIPTRKATNNFAWMKPPATVSERWVTIRGGSYRTKRRDAKLWSCWGKIPARYSASDIGFRCVKDPGK